MVLIQPFFGGTKRTASELRLAEDGTIPQPITDMMWNLSLPVGVDRDSEYSNPTVDGGAKVLDRIKELGWRVEVFGCEGDPLVDRGRELVQLLKGKGVRVMGHFYEGRRHGIFIGDPSMSTKTDKRLKGFISHLTLALGTSMAYFKLSNQGKEKNWQIIVSLSID
ncbi:probable carboxylesterase 120 [Lotus japonicus]|uniref:probable carboxylesterase 120 n=1 Tax=Lotus japonicus TaxID=34305 RepID=UPI0025903D4A|nr:probable carboxylesterase 120 [Lotus japonicus]